jgi:hypothetical protein
MTAFINNAINVNVPAIIAPSQHITKRPKNHVSKFTTADITQDSALFTCSYSQVIIVKFLKLPILAPTGVPTMWSEPSPDGHFNAFDKLLKNERFPPETIIVFPPLQHEDHVSGGFCAIGQSLIVRCVGFGHEPFDLTLDDRNCLVVIRKFPKFGGGYACFTKYFVADITVQLPKCSFMGRTDNAFALLPCSIHIRKVTSIISEEDQVGPINKWPIVMHDIGEAVAYVFGLGSLAYEMLHKVPMILSPDGEVESAGGGIDNE